MKTTLIASFAALAFAAPAAAAPAGGITLGGQQTAPAVELVHGNHRDCRLGPGGRWHYHWRGEWHACGRRPSGPWIWHFEGGRWGWWHPRERRWHERD